MKFARNVPVVRVKETFGSREEMNYLEMISMLDIARMKSKMHRPNSPERKKYLEKAEGIRALISDLSNLTKLCEIPNLPAGNVPLYCFPSTRTQNVNGRASKIAEEVNTLSLAVLTASKNTAITALIKTPSIIPVAMFTEFATTATIFGTVKMIRITIPRTPVSMSQSQQNI